MLEKIASKNYNNQDAWFYIRPKTNDAQIINEIRIKNQYLSRGFGVFGSKDTIVDIGGHIGVFAIECAVRGANVITFEPDPGNYEILLKNIKANAFEGKISAFNEAIGTKEGEAYLYIDDKNPGSHSLLKECVDHLGENKIRVDVTTLDSIEINIKLLKLDCEGLEYEILQNSNLVKVEKIVAELHDRKKSVELVSYLMSKGYFINWYFGKRLGGLQAKRWQIE